MKTHLILIHLFILLTVVHSTSAQNKVPLTDTVFYRGGEIRAVKQYYIGPDSLREGAYKLQGRSDYGEVHKSLTEISVNGGYKNDLQEGEWSFSEDSLTIEISSIKNYKATVAVHGTTTRAEGRYVEGEPFGAWNFEQRQIRNSTLRAPFMTISMYVENGTAKGKFSFKETADDEKRSAAGTFDREGNLDGTWKLEYGTGEQKINEIRSYSEGYLLRLTQLKRSTGDTLKDIIYADVSMKLNASENMTATGGNMIKGEKPFGPQFNNGYRNDDEKLTSQQVGTDMLEDVSEFVNCRDCPMGFTAGNRKIKIATTRRFRYVYTQGEDSVLKALSEKLKTELALADSLKSSAELRINKVKDDSLAAYFELADFYKRRLTHVNSITAEILDGKFDYEFRDNYYSDGVVYTCSTDTVVYSFNGAERYKILEPLYCIDSPDSLVHRLAAYTERLSGYHGQWVNALEGKFRRFRKSARIKEYNLKIVALKDSLETLYLGAPFELTGTDMPTTDIPELTKIQETVFENLGKEKLNQMLLDYSGETDPTDKLAIGDRIIRLIEGLILLKDPLEEIEKIPDQLDKAFTRFSPNPYFPRDIESRIKPHIYNRGIEVLMPHYTRRIERSTDILELEETVREVFIFRDRMNALARQEGDEVNRLNTRIRREGQPERIKRLMEIN